MDSSRLIRMLLDDGWVLVRIKGSHHHFRHRSKNSRVTVTHPKKDVPIGTVRAILKRAPDAQPTVLVVTEHRTWNLPLPFIKILRASTV
ncbi:YcfA-like protein [Caballeronia ptereochthonis]|uniref:YcfA-like protein n=1 Tax=Caballeronia ptereochthonis TaxID=1777144 RepID=A0A158APJ3_9BURK|nr:YcfA-like protein [Caballeronia ptereochthonis]